MEFELVGACKHCPIRTQKVIYAKCDGGKERKKSVNPLDQSKGGRSGVGYEDGKPPVSSSI